MLSTAVQRLLLLATTPLSVVSERIIHSGLQLVTEDTTVETLASENSTLLQRRGSWQLFHDGVGPKVSDVRQGMLGNCYFLAGLVALANTHPEIIEDAFVSEPQRTASSGTYLYDIRFLLDGVEIVVALDDTMPASPSTFFFAETNDGNDVWPLLMEKAWAKLFGSYVATVAGLVKEPFKALTQAPVHTHRSKLQRDGKRKWPKPDELWETLMAAKRNLFPMAAGSMENDIGAPGGHAFAVIDVEEEERESVDMPRRVQVYNPWAFNGYIGHFHEEGSDSHSRGDYWLTFAEFQRAFSTVSVAHIRPGYRISSTHIPVGKPIALRFRINQERPFTVQMEWPTRRLVKVHGCFSEPNHAKLFVAEEDGRSDYKTGNMYATTGNLRVDMEGSGTYLVYAAITYPGAPSVPEVVVNVYAHEDVHFEEITNRPAVEVGREILGMPCEFLVWPGVLWDDVYEALDVAVGGSPAWKKRGATKLIWIGDAGEWKRSTGMNKLNLYKWDFPFHRLECRHTRGETKEQPEEKPEEEVPSGCGFSRGDRVELQAKGSEDVACGVVGSIIGDDEVEVIYQAVNQEYVPCDSSRLHRVVQCPWQPEDQIQFNDGGVWVHDEVVEVLCGKVKLKLKGADIPCGEGMLRYPPGCPFYENERVTVRDPSLDQWRFAEVVRVRGSHVTVLYDGFEEVKPCDLRNEIKKLTRCDKLIRDQIDRLKTLDNWDEIKRTGVDNAFPPELESIGPPDADCGDSADITQGYQRCDRFNQWHTISDVLGPGPL